MKRYSPIVQGNGEWVSSKVLAGMYEDERGEYVKMSELPPGLEVRRIKERAMKDPSNEDRSGWAKAALDLFANLTGEPEEPEEVKVTDLLADLMHYCHLNGVHFQKCYLTACDHFFEELMEEGGKAEEERFCHCGARMVRHADGEWVCHKTHLL